MTKTDMQKALDFHDNYEQKVREAAAYVKPFLGDKKPAFGLILGSGLGALEKAIAVASIIPYKDIPNFPNTTVPGHEGKLIIGSIEGVPVLCFKGRKHYYEVADEPMNNGMLKTVFHIHFLAELGVKNYFTTHAVGGLNLKYKVGDIMIIKSHINLMPNPLLGRILDFKRIDNSQPLERFQPMNNAYDDALRKMLWQACKDYKKQVHKGVLLAVTGSTYETDGESIFFRKGIGADAVGMSVSPETIAARNRGIKVVGFSCISDMIAEDGTNSTSHEEVQAALSSEKFKSRMASIMKKFFALYKENL